jgi:hypothetical protein
VILRKQYSRLKIINKYIKNILFQSDYLLINTVFFIFLSLIFIYSLVFSNSGVYPIKSACSQFPELCISKGLSRAFSQILSGNFEKAMSLNPYSIRIFIFFGLQLLLRLFFSILYLKFLLKRIIMIDIFISVLLFIYEFTPFFVKLYYLLC